MSKKLSKNRILVGVSLHPEVAETLRAFSERTGIPQSRLISDWIKTHCQNEGIKDA